MTAGDGITATITNSGGAAAWWQMQVSADGGSTWTTENVIVGTSTSYVMMTPLGIYRAQGQNASFANVGSPSNQVQRTGADTAPVLSGGSEFGLSWTWSGATPPQWEVDEVDGDGNYLSTLGIVPGSTLTLACSSGTNYVVYAVDGSDDQISATSNIQPS